MDIKLIQGQFDAADAIDIITQMIQVKIKFHESKIDNNLTEEATKMREKRIKDLQTDLKNIREYISEKGERISLQSQINIQ
jgi:hypothetical protein